MKGNFEYYKVSKVANNDLQDFKVTTDSRQSMDISSLHELLCNSNEWINIQQTVKTSLRYLYNISVQQQNQISTL